MDVKLQWRGISLASKCKCCEKPGVETRLHLFVNGSATRRVWQHLARWFPQVPVFDEEGENIELRLKWWQRNMGIRSQHHLCVIIPCLILWHIWTERNENVHRDKNFEVEDIIKRVNSQLRNLVLTKLIGQDQWKGCCPMLDVVIDTCGGARKRKVGRVEWRPPDPLWVKLNVDGAFIQATQNAGGGGIVRNHEGEILVAFATGFKCRSGLEA